MRHGKQLETRPTTHEDLPFFNPGASPPRVLTLDPVHSPSKHSVLDERAFPHTLHVTVNSETLDFDPSLVGDANGVSGLVVSRFYHHVTGTPMFEVDFGGNIGGRAVRVSDTTLVQATTVGDTQRTLFAGNGGSAGDIAGSS